jgi:thioredoxin reductase (NADPH)
MFPRLTEAQVARIASVGTRRMVKAGEVVFEVGDRDTAFFVVLEGELEILRPLATGEERVVLHGRGEFTGEINMLSGRRALVRGRVARDGELLVVDREHLRILVQRDVEISEILMRAFILRRVGLVAQGGGPLVLVGSRHSASTLKLREFLTRNAQPFTYQDVDADPAVQALLDRFQIGVDEVPVILCEAGKVFKNPTVEALARELGLSLDLDKNVVRDVVIVGAGPAGLASAVYAASEGLDALVLEASHRVAKPARARASRTTSASPRGSPGRSSPGAPSRRPRSSAPTWRSAGGPYASTVTRSLTRSFSTTARSCAPARSSSPRA